MKISILTLFPKIIEGYIESSLTKKAIEEKLLEVNIINIRDFALDKHKSCDDEPYGGGYGMILKPEPLALALEHCGSPQVYTIYPSPVAPLYTQKDAETLAKKEEIIFICGRYEGIDQRIIEMFVSDVFSLGPYVLSSGEIASLTIIDSIYRLISGVIRKESLLEESHTNGSLEYPQYTRPANFRGNRVPEVLLSGNHLKIQEWRKLKSTELSNKYLKNN